MRIHMHWQTHTPSYTHARTHKVLAHLRAENAYTEVQTSPLAPFRSLLYKELLSHVKETDDTSPVPDGPWDYFSRTIEGLR